MNENTTVVRVIPPLSLRRITPPALFCVLIKFEVKTSGSYVSSPLAKLTSLAQYNLSYIFDVLKFPFNHIPIILPVFFFFFF
jgi:hypothetical protein